jgi:hypothetical protein
LTSSSELDIKKFTAFISYFEHNGKKNAEIVREVLKENRGISAFVAHIERNTYSDDFERVRREVINNCDTFIFINTINSLSRPQIIEEFRLAYPNGYSESPKLHIFYQSVIGNKRSSLEFEKAIGFEQNKILTYNQHDFDSDDQLSTRARQLFDKKELTGTSNSANFGNPQETSVEIVKHGVFLGREDEISDITHILKENKIVSIIGE